MENPTEPNEAIAQGPLTEIEKFVTRMWEHPLVDERMRKHRTQGTEFLEKIVDVHGLSDSRWIGIPVGSTLWVVNPESDHDFALVIPNDHPKGFMDIYYDYSHENSHNKTKKLPIDIVRIGSESDLLRIASTEKYALLFTPDEYIAGDLNLAHSLRLRIVDKMSRENKFPDDMSDWLEWYVKKWPQLGDKREGRYKAALKERAWQSNDPFGWRRVFEDNVANLKLPSFEDYASAIKQRNGALNINPRFVAKGITSEA